MGLLSRMTFESFKPQGYGLPPRQRENLKRAYELAKGFAQDPKGWLVLSGGYGCGKTHLAAAIANYRLGQGEPVLFVVVPDLLDHLRATFSPDSAVAYDERFETVRTAPLLILDDLGTQSSTPWAQEKLYQIINYRYNAQLPMVITTNHPLDEIDARLRSRMTDPDLCQVYIIEARDFRASGGDRDEGQSIISLYADQTFEAFDSRRPELPPDEQENLRRAYTIAKEYAEKPQGWLVFMGMYGCGKTHLAAAIANYLHLQGHPVRFEVVPDLLDHLRATFEPGSAVSYDQRFNEVRRAWLLVLDDMGLQNATPWAQEKLFQILNHRYVARLPTVITVSDDGWEQLDERLKSRFLDANVCKLVEIDVPRYRGAEPEAPQPRRTTRRRE